MRPGGQQCGRFAIWVSIHASVKDATFDVLSARIGHLVSIHASVKDATGKDCRINR